MYSLVPNIRYFFLQIKVVLCFVVNYVHNIHNSVVGILFKINLG